MQVKLYRTDLVSRAKHRNVAAETLESVENDGAAHALMGTVSLRRGSAINDTSLMKEEILGASAPEVMCCYSLVLGEK